MTEKRFILTETSYIYDNQDNGICPTLESVVKVLNELAEENKQLKQEMGDLGTAHAEEISKIEDEFDEEILKLEKENEQLKEEIARQKFSKKIMRENIKSYEREIKRLRKSYNKFDEMRLDRIRFLEKRLKKNGLSIYVNDCEELE